MPWASTAPSSDEEWIVNGLVQVPDHLLRAQRLGDVEGPWVLAYGFLLDRNEEAGREVFGFLRTLLVPEQLTERVVQNLTERAHLGNDFIPSEPSVYYTYAGEIPWSDWFTVDLYSVDGDPLYRRPLRHEGDDAIVEILSHAFAWESYHSAMNDAGGVSVPSAAFSRHFDLRARAQQFDQAEFDGTAAALVYRAPEGFEGHVLYLREDLVREYAAATGAQILFAAWGERQLARGGWENPPDWLRTAYTDSSMVWRRVVRIEEVGL